jgi:NADH:ubiquinone oxidoreductase subunit 2 (subunit N)
LYNVLVILNKTTNIQILIVASMLPPQLTAARQQASKRVCIFSMTYHCQYVVIQAGGGRPADAAQLLTVLTGVAA